jgi:hypothetical protein
MDALRTNEMKATKRAPKKLNTTTAKGLASISAASIEREGMEPDFKFQVDQGEVKIITWFRPSPDNPKTAYIDIPPEGLKEAIAERIQTEFPRARSGDIYFFDDHMRVYFHLGEDEERRVND